MSSALSVDPVAAARPRPVAQRLHLRNEFTTIEITRDDAANGPRLVLKDLGAGRQVVLDLMEVESLTRINSETLVQFVKPS